MNYSLTFTPGATQLFRKLPRNAQEQLDEKLLEVERDPYTAGEKLKGKYKRFYRTRSGDYRVVYDIQGGKLVVLVVVVGNRKEVYDLLNRAGLV